MKTYRFSFKVVVAAFAVSFLSGCDGSKESTSEKKSSEQKSGAQKEKSDHGHDHPAHGGHGAGPHDGTLADWGGGKYHVEFTVDHGKNQSIVYILGSDEKSPVPIKTDKVQLSIKSPDIQVDLKADPLKGEAKGTSSRFVGTHKNLGIVQEYQGSISGVIDGTPYVGNFKEEPHGH